VPEVLLCSFPSLIVLFEESEHASELDEALCEMGETCRDVRYRRRRQCERLPQGIRDDQAAAIQSELDRREIAAVAECQACEC
jgi:hypothetical protein